VSAADHLLKALRETLRGPGRPRRTAGEVALLLAAFDQVTSQVAGARERSRSLIGALGQRAADAEHVASIVRTLLARAGDVRSAAQATRDSLEGVRLLALNSGLEGSRMADASSAALLRLSEEVRSRAVQGIEGLDELLSLLEQLSRDRETMRETVNLLGGELRTLEQSSATSHEGLVEIERALGELGEAIESATGADPALAPLLAAAAEHSKGLVVALSQLASRDGAKLALRSLQPLLEPLLGVLDEIYGQDEDEREPR
jgi:hypothetical protein